MRDGQFVDADIATARMHEVLENAGIERFKAKSIVLKILIRSYLRENPSQFENVLLSESPAVQEKVIQLLGEDALLLPLKWRSFHNIVSTFAAGEDKEALANE